MRANNLLFGVLILGSACVATTGANSNDLEGGGGDTDSDECKIEGSQIGQEGVVVLLGAKTVTITDWIGKSGSANEYVGFSVGLAGGSTISYVVKAGGERHSSSTVTWMHPNGPDGGSQAPGISNVDFCGECEGGDCGGDDPSCDNPDGCDGGGGGGGGGGGDCDNPDGCDTGGTGPLL